MATCFERGTGTPANPARRWPETSALEVKPELREQEYERCWGSANFTLYWCYNDVLTDKVANATVGEFVRAKIRARIDDPKLADLLVPTAYPVMTKRRRRLVQKTLLPGLSEGYPVPRRTSTS